LPENVWEFDSCQGNLRKLTKSEGSVKENLTGKTYYCFHIWGCASVNEHHAVKYDVDNLGYAR